MFRTKLYWLIALLLSSGSTIWCDSIYGQEVREGAMVCLLSDRSIKAWLEDDSKIEVPFGTWVTVEEIVPNHIATRYKGQYVLFDSDFVFPTEQAKQYLEKQIEKEPTAALYRVKASAEHGLRNLRQALADIDKSIELDPDEVKAWTLRGSIKATMKKYDEAHEALDQALELDPKYPHANSVKFYVLQRTRNYDEALEYIEKAVELDPHRGIYHVNKGSVLQQLGRTEEATECFKKAIEVEPCYHFGHYFLGYQAWAADKHAESKPHFARSAELNPKHYWSQNYLMRLAEEEGDEEVRFRHLALSAEARDAPRSVRNSYAWLLATSSEEEIRDGKKALEIARKLVEEEDAIHNKCGYLKTQAAAHAELGEFKEALELIEEIESHAYSDFQLPGMREQFEAAEPFREYGN